jgi:CheY-like chemotaxis protein
MAAIGLQPPDLILLDLRMPVMDGYQVIQEVKSRPETNHIPIVVMTAHRIDHDRIDLLHMAAEQLTKPLSAEDLVDHVEQMLVGEQ